MRKVVEITINNTLTVRGEKSNENSDMVFSLYLDGVNCNIDVDVLEQFVEFIENNGDR